MMDESNTGPSLELGDCMDSWIEYSWFFGEGVAPPTLEVFDKRSLLDLKVADLLEEAQVVACMCEPLMEP